MAVTMGHPIAAIATGHGRSGIGILRMSGEGCIERAAKVFTRADGKPLEAAEDRKLVLGTMTDAEGRPSTTAWRSFLMRRTPIPVRTPWNFSATVRPPR